MSSKGDGANPQIVLFGINRFYYKQQTKYRMCFLKKQGVPGWILRCLETNSDIHTTEVKRGSLLIASLCNLIHSLVGSE